VAGKQQSFLFSIRDKSKDPISNMANNNRRWNPTGNCIETRYRAGRL
jgi:hypothetical protein